jgi:DNA polymerase-3 subunit gamma/tau
MKKEQPVLYRKYRPENFGEVVGQTRIVEALQNAIKKNALSHAYLFHGGRGTGKTTVARILAKEFGTSMNDLVEIDAASNRKIEDVRELREGVKTLPFESKYKVYIIDEVHMLTNEAFNALLKTLEEPPAHVKFILATTELHKIPQTILSRCEIYTFEEPTHDILTERVSDVAKEEGYKISKENAGLIASLGEGSFRDALGVLQKVISGIDDKEITEMAIMSGGGMASKSSVRDFILAFVTSDREAVLRAFHESLASRIDPETFIEQVLHMMRMGLLLKISKQSTAYVAGHISKEDMKFLEDIIAKHSEHFNSKLLAKLLDAYTHIEQSPIPELAIEMAISDII